MLTLIFWTVNQLAQIEDKTIVYRTLTSLIAKPVCKALIQFWIFWFVPTHGCTFGIHL